jgi:hypothetical protein
MGNSVSLACCNREERDPAKKSKSLAQHRLESSNLRDSLTELLEEVSSAQLRLPVLLSFTYLPNRQTPNPAIKETVTNQTSWTW